MQGGLKSYFNFVIPTSSTRVFRVNSGHLFIKKNNNIFNMKLFVLAAVLCSIFAVAFGAEKRPIERYSTEEDATRYCNSLYPAKGVTHQKIIDMVVNRDPLGSTRSFGSAQWCNLHCMLEQLGYFAPDGSMRNRFILEVVLDFHPQLAPSSPLIYHTLLQIDASTKDMTDKCSKAFISYYRFAEALLLGTLYNELEAKPNVKGKVVKAFLGGNELPQEYDAIAKKSAQFVETMFSESTEKIANTCS